MFNSTVISVNTPDNHSIFIDLFRNETETILNTLLLAKLTEFLSYDKYDITQVILGMDIMFGNITIKIYRRFDSEFSQLQKILDN